MFCVGRLASGGPLFWARALFRAWALFRAERVFWAGALFWGWRLRWSLPLPAFSRPLSLLGRGPGDCGRAGFEAIFSGG